MSNLSKVKENPESYKNIEEFFMSFYGQQADANDVISAIEDYKRSTSDHDGKLLFSETELLLEQGLDEAELRELVDQEWLTQGGGVIGEALSKISDYLVQRL